MGRGAAADPDCSRVTTALTAFLDTNVLIRHFTGDPPDLAARATAALASADELLLADLVVAECVYVLESFYEVPRERIAELMRAAICLPSIKRSTLSHCCVLSRSMKCPGSTSPRPSWWPKQQLTRSTPVIPRQSRLPTNTTGCSGPVGG